MNIKWETPPTVNRPGRSDPAELDLAETLRSRPDQWARVQDFAGDDQAKAGQFAQYIRSGKRAAFRADGSTEDGVFEAVSRKIRGTDITAVYVRYATLNND